jgi:hypothetical protein
VAALGKRQAISTEVIRATKLTGQILVNGVQIGAFASTTEATLVLLHMIFVLKTSTFVAEIHLFKI